MKGKEHYSYFLIKPDGIRYFNEIKQEICEKGFDRVMFLQSKIGKSYRKIYMKNIFKKRTLQKDIEPLLMLKKFYMVIKQL